MTEPEATISRALEEGYGMDQRVMEGVHRVGLEEGESVLQVWEASVRATHHFLTESDIQFFKPLVLPGLFSLPHLLCVRAISGVPVGFVGVADDRMEALFVHPTYRGIGIGRRLATHATRELGSRAVDVNEENEAAVAFYRHLGFEVETRSPLDSTGKPFPLLHMRMRGTTS